MKTRDRFSILSLERASLKRDDGGTAVLRFLGLLVGQLVLFALCASAQDFAGVGQPTAATPEPAEMGFVETSNGHLHLDIPLGSLAQRGSIQDEFHLVYDSNIWQEACGGGCIWTPTVAFAGYIGGWRAPSVVNNPWAFGYSYVNTSNKYYNFYWTDPEGIAHYFPLTLTGGQAGDAFSTDSSGYHLYITSSPIGKVYAKDGTLVYQNAGMVDKAGNPIAMEDANGNYISAQAIYPYNMFDTVGRQVQPLTIGSTSSLSLPTSSGNQAVYTLNYATIQLKSNFGKAGVTDCSLVERLEADPYGNLCQITVVQSIVLPDNTSYAFTYDCDSSNGNQACSSPAGQAAYYGEMTSMTLPSGGTVNYQYSNFSDTFGGVTRYLTSRTSAGGTWRYTPVALSTCTGKGCEEQVTVTKPNGDSTVYVISLNNGAWPLRTQYFSGGSLVATKVTYWDFGYSCPLTGCSGNAYIRKLMDLYSVPAASGSISKRTSYEYANAQAGLVGWIFDWGYYPGAPTFGNQDPGSPTSIPTFPTVADRTTYLTYYTPGIDNINLVQSSITCNNVGSQTACPGAGSMISSTSYAYDQYPLAPASGIQNHDDTNFGAGSTKRGNVNSVSRWINSSSATSILAYYDATGQIVQSIDQANNSTTFGYADRFYNDTGSDPSSTVTPAASTNAYVTSVVSPIGTESYSYYFGSGKEASFTDLNKQTTFYHYNDAQDRLTDIHYPIGWSLTRYTSPTLIETYDPVADATPSTVCSSCQHKQILLDPFGRKTSSKLVNNPAGDISVDQIGVPGEFCTSLNYQRCWYERSLLWREERSIRRSRS